MSASNATREDLDDFDGLRKEMVAPISDCVTLIASLSAIELEYRRRANVAARILESLMEAQREGLSPSMQDLYAARDLGEFLMEAGVSSSPGADELARHHDHLWAAADDLITLRTHDDRN
jgi:hypothetical protein